MKKIILILLVISHILISQEVEVYSSGEVAPTGDFNWQTISSNLYKVKEDRSKYARVSVDISSIGKGGFLNIDDIKVDEFNENGDFIRTVFFDPIDELGNWTYWTCNYKGKYGLSLKNGSSNRFSYSFTGATSNSTLTSKIQFEVSKGNYYRVSGRILGRNIRDDAIIRFQLEVIES